MRLTIKGRVDDVRRATGLAMDIPGVEIAIHVADCDLEVDGDELALAIYDCAALLAALRGE